MTLTGLEPATKASASLQLKTDAKGVAVFARAIPGRYSITGDFRLRDGISPRHPRRPGETRHVVVLPLGKLTDSVVVGGDTQENAAIAACRSSG